MQDEADRQLVGDVALAIVQKVAPDELPLFDDVGAAYFDDPSALKKGKAKDRPLGFGVGEAAEFLTPVAFAVGAFLVDVLKAAGTKLAVDGLSGWIKDLLRPGRQVKPLPSLAQIQEIRQAVFTQAKTWVDDERARQVADAVHELLLERALGKPEDGARP